MKKLSSWNWICIRLKYILKSWSSRRSSCLQQLGLLGIMQSDQVEYLRMLGRCCRKGKYSILSLPARNVVGADDVNEILITQPRSCFAACSQHIPQAFFLPFLALLPSLGPFSRRILFPCGRSEGGFESKSNARWFSGRVGLSAGSSSVAI